MENSSGSVDPKCLVPCLDLLVLDLYPVKCRVVRGIARMDVQLPTGCGRAQSMVSTRIVIP